MLGKATKRQSIFRIAAILCVYWAILLFFSLGLDGLPVDTRALLPGVIVGGIPILIIAGATIWSSARAGMRDLALVDDLTGLRNRRAFTQRARALMRNTRPGHTSLVLLDIDGLKQINDGCGHQAGDELLAQVAAHLSGVTGAVFRVGGDEFAILVNRSRGESVTGMLQALKPLHHTFRSCGHQHEIHFSYGFASYRPDESFENTFRRADARLREFKQQLYQSGRMPERRTLAAAVGDNGGAPVEHTDGYHAVGEQVVSIFARQERKRRQS